MFVRAPSEKVQIFCERLLHAKRGDDDEDDDNDIWKVVDD